MAVHVYRNTDSGAPTLGTTAGAITGVLNWALVTNAGWTSTSLGTNQVKYVQPQTPNRILQVDDSGAGSARVTGWETLTALNTGTGQFPTTAGFVNHSTSGNAAWRLFASSNANLFHLTINYNSASNFWDIFTFGDFSSYYSGTDNFNQMIGAASAASTNMGWVAGAAGAFWSTSSTKVGLDRSFNQSTLNPTTGVISGTEFGTGINFPNNDGWLYLSPFWITETASSVRGLIPGIWNVHMVATPGLPDGTIFTCSSGNLNGRSFEIVGRTTTNLGTQAVAIETSNTWGGF